MNDHQFESVLNIRIDRIVLDGIAFNGHQQLQFREALQTALHEHFSIAGIPGNLASISSPAKITATPLLLSTPAIEPAGFGKQIAGSVYNGIKQEI